MTENKRFKNVEENLEWGTVQYFTYYDEKINDEELEKLVNHLLKENEQLKIRNKGKQAFIDKQDKIIRLLYNQCKDFKEILDDSNITYPIDERLNKFFEKGVKLWAT